MQAPRQEAATTTTITTMEVATIIIITTTTMEVAGRATTSCRPAITHPRRAPMALPPPLRLPRVRALFTPLFHFFHFNAPIYLLPVPLVPALAAVL